MTGYTTGGLGFLGAVSSAEVLEVPQDLKPITWSSDLLRDFVSGNGLNDQQTILNMNGGVGTESLPYGKNTCSADNGDYYPCGNPPCGATINGLTVQCPTTPNATSKESGLMYLVRKYPGRTAIVAGIAAAVIQRVFFRKKG